MAYYDLPRDQLEAYLPERDEPDDFDDFWTATLEETRSHPLDAQFEQVDNGLVTLETYDVTFNGYAGQPIKGWLMLPAGREGVLPCIVEYIGYGGGRGLSIEWLNWASAGFAHFVMDTRGQGSVWRKGDTPDLSPDGDGPQYPGFVTRGILDPKTYYYRRLFSDAVRAVEAAKSHQEVDGSRIGITGMSQGGGMTVAVAGLVPDLKIAMPDVPFLCNCRRAVEILDSQPYREIVHFCKIHRDEVGRVFHTLSYFDGMNFAVRADSRALFSVALMDMLCPPSTVYAAYNHYQGPKEIRVYPFNGHEGGEARHLVEKIPFARQHL